MAYTPENNPYIPGDPYSYDLKWIVDQIKYAISLYEPLHDEFTDLSGDFTDLSGDFTELHNYVMNYFASLDLTQEVSSKLDQMAEDGTLDTLLLPYFNEYKTEINGIVANQNNTINNRMNAQDDDISVLKARMDTFASLPSGSTEGNAELLDIRVAGTGRTYASAGNAVRGQFNTAFNGAYKKTANLLDFGLIGDTWTQGYPGGSELFACHTNPVAASAGLSVYGMIDPALLAQVFNYPTTNLIVYFYDAANDLISNDTLASNNGLPATKIAPANTAYIVFALTSTAWGNNISPSDLDAAPVFAYAGFEPITTGAKIPANYVRFSDAVYEELVNEPECYVSMIPSANLISIDTSTKTITIPADILLIDRRFANGYKSLPAITYDYSSIISSAIKFYWDINNDTIIAGAYNTIFDKNKYILMFTLRNNKSWISSNIPMIVDGKYNGLIDLAEISRGFLWRNDIVKGYAHRGYSAVAPENTLPAFKLARDYGFYGVETDVRFTSDGIAVLLHDLSINRTARNMDGTTIDTTIDIDSITYAQALNYDFGIWMGSEYAGTHIPTFEAFLKACHRLGLHAKIELKTGTQAQIEALADAVIRYGMEKDAIFISYNAIMLSYVKDHAPTLSLAYLSSSHDAAQQAIVAALRTGENTVEYNLDNYAAVSESVINSLIADAMPLSVYMNGDYSIANSDPYICSITTDTGMPGEYMYKYWTLNL